MKMFVLCVSVCCVVLKIVFFKSKNNETEYLLGVERVKELSVFKGAFLALPLQ